MSAERERIADRVFDVLVRYDGGDPAEAEASYREVSDLVADAVLGELGDIFGIAERLADDLRWFLNAKLPPRGQLGAQAEYLNRALDAQAALVEYDARLHSAGEVDA